MDEEEINLTESQCDLLLDALDELQITYGPDSRYSDNQKFSDIVYLQNTIELYRSNLKGQAHG